MYEDITQAQEWWMAESTAGRMVEDGDGERRHGRNILFATWVFSCIHNINTWGRLMPMQIYWFR